MGLIAPYTMQEKRRIQTVSDALHKSEYAVISFHLQYFLISLKDSSSTHVLFNFQMFGDFKPVFQLLISNLISWWSKYIL